MRARILSLVLSDEAGLRLPMPAPRRLAILARQLLLPLAVGLFSGCFSAPTKWVRPGPGSQTATQQLAGCQLFAERLHYPGDESREDRAARIKHEAELCMQAEGWLQVELDSPQATEQASKPSPLRVGEQDQEHTS